LRGTPTIYYGDELGMTDVDIPPEQQLDPFGFRVPGWGRDRCRTPMQWNAGTNAGFSSAKPGELWLPVSEQYPTVNLESQQKDPASTFNLYRNLLQLRKSSPALQVGKYSSVTTASPDCFAYTRSMQAESYLVILNFSSNETIITLQDSGRGKVVLSTYLDRTGEVDLCNLNLRGDEGLIVQING
jgi:alpha-glucosidase